MENATIAHECSSLRRGNDLTKWIHTILSGHRHTSFNGSTANSVALLHMHDHFVLRRRWASCLTFGSMRGDGRDITKEEDKPFRHGGMSDDCVAYCGVRHSAK